MSELPNLSQKKRVEQRNVPAVPTHLLTCATGVHTAEVLASFCMCMQAMHIYIGSGAHIHVGTRMMLVVALVPPHMHKVTSACTVVLVQVGVQLHVCTLASHSRGQVANSHGLVPAVAHSLGTPVLTLKTVYQCELSGVHCIEE